MGIGEHFERLIDLMARLRGPNGCPWDREQTLKSLRPFILEEAYELIDAIDSSRPEAIREELGDFLLEFLFVSQISAEESYFTIREVMSRLEDKLIRRHPHVFRTETARDPDEARGRWEAIKDEEKAQGESLIQEPPRALPALVRASKLSAQAARAGFDWRSADEVMEKLSEEVAELQTARESTDPESLVEEIGDLLLVVVNLARHLGVDPELALQGANRKFVDRFRHVEKRLREQGRSFAESIMEEMEALWQEAKDREAGVRGSGVGKKHSG